MDEVCRLKNIPRDAFINRIILFLIAKPIMFERITGIDLQWYWIHKVVVDFSYQSPLMPYHLDGGLSAIEELVKEDPFWAIRRCIEAAATDDDSQSALLHKLHIPADLFSKHFESSLGFNCYLEDRHIPGHPAEKAWHKEADRLFADLLDQSMQSKTGELPMSLPASFTQHARNRAKQRCIPPLIDEWLERFGEEDYDGHGGLRRYFSRKSVRAMQRAFGREPIARMSNYLNVYKIESTRDGKTITIGYRTKRGNRK